MKVVINGLVLNYELVGEGRIILLLHGWGVRASGLNIIKDELVKKYQILSVDLPGFGDSDNPDKAWGLEDYAVCVSNLVKKLKLEVYAVIGHSNGGAIAIKMIADKLLVVQRLILLASAGIRNQYKGKNRIIRVVAKTGKFIVYILPSSTRKKVKAVFYTKIGSDLLVAEHLQPTFKKIITEDITTDASKIDILTLLIYGKEDQSTPVSYGQLLSNKIKKSRLIILDNAEHFVYLDQPNKVNKLIEDFLQ